MKRIFLLLILLTSLRVTAQISVEVVPADTTVCYNDSTAFRAIVTGADNVMYKWLKNGVEIYFQEDSLLTLSSVTRDDTAAYQCVVTYGMEMDTSEPAYLRVYDEIVFDTLYRYNELGCPGVCKGQFKTHISGGLPPYDYNWGGGYSQDTIVFGLCPGEHTLTITDARGCKARSGYLVDVLKLPKVEFDVLPGDTIYLTKPTMTLQFSDTALPYMVNWEWSLKKSPDTTLLFSASDVNPVTYIFDSTGTFQVYLNYTNQNGCDTTLITDVVVRTVKLKIPAAFTPNNDGSNETYEIKVDDSSFPEDFDYRIPFEGTEFTVWDRWGKKVYSRKNYQSGDWDGDNLSDGVYFYILTCKGHWGDEVYRGTITILTGDL